MQWFRLYDEMMDDPKVLSLSFESRWYYICLLSCASRQPRRGDLPDMKAISIHLRTSKPKAEKIVREFIGLGFIDATTTGSPLRIHGWDGRQFKSDDVTARTGTFRERSQERLENGHLNAPETFPRADPRSVSGSVSVSESVLNSGGAGGNQNPPAEVAALAALAETRWPAQNADTFVGDLCQTFDHRLVGQILDQAFDKDPAKLPRAWIRSGCRNQFAAGWKPADAAPRGQKAAANGVLPSQWVDPVAEAKNAKIRVIMLENERKREAKNAGH